jgi:WhiB family redox-sensing transcriptional regulator
MTLENPAVDGALQPARHTDNDLPWQQRGMCSQVDPELFHPERGAGISNKQAKAVCLSCEVQTQCLQYALEHDERWGIWGGYTEFERRRLKNPQPRTRRQLNPPTLYLPRCGTESGAKDHNSRGEHACTRCKHAATDARRERRIGT